MKIQLPLFIILVVLVSCNHSKQNVDISEYYFEIKNFESPRVYQYKSVYYGIESNLYSKYTKIKKDELLLEQFNDSFLLTNRTILKYTSKGIKYSECWTSDQNSNLNLYRQSIIDSLVFPLNLKNNPLVFKTESSPNSNTNITYTLRNNLTAPRDTIINNHTFKILYGYAYRLWTVKSLIPPFSEQKIKVKDLVIYQKGTGLTVLRSFKENKEFFRMKLDRILTIEEFESLKNASK